MALFKKRRNLSDYCTFKLVHLLSQDTDDKWEEFRRGLQHDQSLIRADGTVYSNNLAAASLQLMFVAITRNSKFGVGAEAHHFVSTWLKERHLSKIDDLSGEYSQAFGSSSVDGVPAMAHLFIEKVTGATNATTAKAFCDYFYVVLNGLFYEFESIKLVAAPQSGDNASESKVSPTPGPNIFCNSCGSSIARAAEFCTSCGMRVQTFASSQETPYNILDAADESVGIVKNAPGGVSDVVAGLIAHSFSFTQFTELFKDQKLAEEWTSDDALTVWYSMGNLVLVIATWQTYRDKATIFSILDRTRSTLKTKWGISETQFEKLRAFINETEGEAVTSFVSCKSGDDLFRFFSRYTDRIIGLAVPFSASTFEVQLMGKQSHHDPLLPMKVSDLFIKCVGIVKETLESSQR